MSTTDKHHARPAGWPGGRAPVLDRPGSTPSPSPSALEVPDAPGLARRRLVERVEAARDARILTVTGLSGSGKTTALAHWARRTGTDVAWWRATPLEASIAGVAVGIGEAIHALSPSRRCPVDAAALAAEINRHGGPLTVVIDDAHHVVSPEVAGFLEDVLLSTSVHLVLASRESLPINLARCELPGDVVGMGELRFRTSETAALFDTVYGQPLTDSDARWITRQTGGWAAALELLHHALRDQSEDARRQAIAELPGSASYAADYVDAQVWATLDQPDLEVLLRSAPAEHLTGDRCDAILGTSDSEPTLHALAARGVLEELNGTYRINPVLRARALCRLRAELGADGLARAHQTWAGWLERDGHPAAAVRAHLAAGDHTAARATLDRNGASILHDPDLSWLSALEGGSSDWVRVCRAARLLRDGRLDDARRELDEAPASGTGLVEQYLTALRRFLLIWAGEEAPGPAPWFECLRATLRVALTAPTGTHPTTSHPGDRLATALGHAVTGDVTAALRILEGEGAESGWLSLANQLLQCCLRADPAQARRIAEEADALGIPWLARVAEGIAEPSGTDRAVLTADARGDPWGALVLAGFAAVRRLRQGQPDPGAFDDVASRCRALDVPVLEAWARCGLALAAVATRAPDAARDVESAIGFAHSAGLPAAATLGWIAHAQLHGEKDRLDQAIGQAERVGLGCRPWEWGGATAASETTTVSASGPPPVEVRCFGGFSLQLRGFDADLHALRPRSRAVLRMLALEAGRFVHREQLIDALWPQLAPGAATHNLHVAISSLRAALEPDAPRGKSQLVVRDGDRYALLLPPGSLADLPDFDREVERAAAARHAGDVDAAIAHLRMAMDHCRGEVLPEDGPADWVLPVRERYRLHAAEAAAHLADLLLSRHLVAEAAAAALRSVEADPCRDGSWRLLIAAYDAAGDLAAAQHARCSYAEVLSSLGVAESASLSVHAPRH